MTKARKIHEIKNGEVVQTFESIRKAGETLNIPFRSISCVLSGRYKQTHGRYFKFALGHFKNESKK